MKRPDPGIGASDVAVIARSRMVPRSLDLLVAMYSTRDATEAARSHLLQMEQSGIVEIIDLACIVCLSRDHIAFWTSFHLETPAHRRAVIQGLNPALLAISEAPRTFAPVKDMHPYWGLIEKPDDVPLAGEIRDYMLPGMAGLVLIIEPLWLAKVEQGIDGYERLLQRRLTPTTGTPRSEESG
jgi:hypothetical protein